MKKICRLTISYAGKMDDGGDMHAVVNAGLLKAGVSMADIELHGPEYGDNTHYGNWVLTPVLDNEATAKLAAALSTRIDMQHEKIEASDIAGFNIGDRVTVGRMNAFCMQTTMQGKVFSKSENKIGILKKGTRSGKGWMIHAGDEATIKRHAGLKRDCIKNGQ